jgi:3-mercaptopyruvate sulfurtransferase SseA
MGNTNTSIYDGSWSEYGGIDEPDFKHGGKHGWDESGKK